MAANDRPAALYSGASTSSLADAVAAQDMRHVLCTGFLSRPVGPYPWFASQGLSVLRNVTLKRRFHTLEIVQGQNLQSHLVVSANPSDKCEALDLSTLSNVGIRPMTNTVLVLDLNRPWGTRSQHPLIEMHADDPNEAYRWLSAFQHVARLARQHMRLKSATADALGPPRLSPPLRRDNLSAPLSPRSLTPGTLSLSPEGLAAPLVSSPDLSMGLGMGIGMGLTVQLPSSPDLAVPKPGAGGPLKVQREEMAATVALTPVHSVEVPVQSVRNVTREAVVQPAVTQEDVAKPRAMKGVDMEFKPRELQAEPEPASPRDAEPESTPESPRADERMAASPRAVKTEQTPAMAQTAKNPRIAQGERTPMTPRKARAERTAASPRNAHTERTPASPRMAQGERAPMTPRMAKADRTPASPRNAHTERTPASPRIAQGERTPMTPRMAKADRTPASPRMAKVEDTAVDSKALCDGDFPFTRADQSPSKRDKQEPQLVASVPVELPKTPTPVFWDAASITTTGSRRNKSAAAPAQPKEQPTTQPPAAPPAPAQPAQPATVTSPTSKAKESHPISLANIEGTRVRLGGMNRYGVVENIDSSTGKYRVRMEGKNIVLQLAGELLRPVEPDPEDFSPEDKFPTDSLAATRATASVSEASVTPSYSTNDQHKRKDFLATPAKANHASSSTSSFRKPQPPPQRADSHFDTQSFLSDVFDKRSVTSSSFPVDAFERLEDTDQRERERRRRYETDDRRKAWSEAASLPDTRWQVFDQQSMPDTHGPSNPYSRRPMMPRLRDVPEGDHACKDTPDPWRIDQESFDGASFTKSKKKKRERTFSATPSACSSSYPGESLFDAQALRGDYPEGDGGRSLPPRAASGKYGGYALEECDQRSFSGMSRKMGTFDECDQRSIGGRSRRNGAVDECDQRSMGGRSRRKGTVDECDQRSMGGRSRRKGSANAKPAKDTFVDNAFDFPKSTFKDLSAADPFDAFADFASLAPSQFDDFDKKSQAPSLAFEELDKRSVAPSYTLTTAFDDFDKRSLAASYTITTAVDDFDKRSLAASRTLTTTSDDFNKRSPATSRNLAAFDEFKKSPARAGTTAFDDLEKRSPAFSGNFPDDVEKRTSPACRAFTAAFDDVGKRSPTGARSFTAAFDDVGKRSPTGARGFIAAFEDIEKRPSPASSVFTTTVDDLDTRSNSHPSAISAFDDLKTSNGDNVSTSGKSRLEQAYNANTPEFVEQPFYRPKKKDVIARLTAKNTDTIPVTAPSNSVRTIPVTVPRHAVRTIPVSVPDYSKQEMAPLPLKSSGAWATMTSSPPSPASTVPMDEFGRALPSFGRDRRGTADFGRLDSLPENAPMERPRLAFP